MGTYKISDTAKLVTVSKNTKILCESDITADNDAYTDIEQMSPYIKVELQDEFDKFKKQFFSGGYIELKSTTSIQVRDGINCRDFTNSVNIVLANGFWKDCNAPFVEGSGNGALDTGVALSTFYQYSIFAIAKADGTSDILIAKSGTTPVMPSGYLYKREIGRFFVNKDGLIDVIYNYYQIQNSKVGSLPTYLPANYFAGFSLQYNDNTSITITQGATKNENNTLDLIYPGLELTKRINTAWARGHNVGMLDTGAIADNTTYYIFVIGNEGNGSVDFLMSLSPTAPIMPGSYNTKQLIGYLYTGDYSGSSEYYVHTKIARPFISGYSTAPYYLTYAFDNIYERILASIKYENINQFEVSGSKIKYIGLEKKSFEIIINTVFKGDTLNEFVYVTIKKNSSGVSETMTNYEMYQKIIDADTLYNLSVSVALELTTDDEIELVSKTTTAGATTVFAKIVILAKALD